MDIFMDIFGDLFKYGGQLLWIVFQLIVVIAIYIYIIRQLGFRLYLIIRENVLKQDLTPEEREAFGLREKKIGGGFSAVFEFLKKGDKK